MPPDAPDVPPPDEVLLTPKQFRAALGVHRNTVVRWVNAGKLKPVTLPSGQRKYRQSDVDAILATADQPKAKTA